MPPAPKTTSAITVTATDSFGGTRSVEVQADSAYEAALRGLAALYTAPVRDPGSPPAEAERIHVVQVQITTVVTHTVPLQSIDRYLEAGSRGARDTVVRRRLKELRALLPF